MPQTMQQKRKGSLERLNRDLQFRISWAERHKPIDRVKYERKVDNLRRTIANTEAAIQRGGR